MVIGASQSIYQARYKLKSTESSMESYQCCVWQSETESSVNDRCFDRFYFLQYWENTYVYYIN